jgi:seryl-tRNA synthetase
MWGADAVLRVLRERGELWQAMPGLVGMRGPALALYRDIERALAALAGSEGAEEWRVPAAIALETLERADYFECFPQWLTVAAHLSDDSTTLERVARAPSPAAAARDAAAPARAALAPAVCYHVYAALAGSTVAAPRYVTAQGTCWRHEGRRLVPLEREWAFTMREVVCVGAPGDVRAFLERAVCRVTDLADALDVTGLVVEATDPFFAPTGRGKLLVQRMKGLKRELLLPIAPGHRIAAASFNDHETFFGEAFGIRLPDGTPASTGCVAFGLERWMLAFLAEHGADTDAWPAVAQALVADEGAWRAQ